MSTGWRSTDDEGPPRPERALGCSPRSGPWYAEASAVWNANANGRISAFMAPFSAPTIYYIIVRTQNDLTRAHQAVEVCLRSLSIAPIGRIALEKAMIGPGSDSEDNLQIACAVQAGVDAIVTRDPRGFSHSPSPASAPADRLAHLGSSPPTP